MSGPNADGALSVSAFQSAVRVGIRMVAGENPDGTSLEMGAEANYTPAEARRLADAIHIAADTAESMAKGLEETKP